jgi:hypothetical protein
MKQDKKIGLSIKLSVKVNIRPKLITMDTKLKLSYRSRGISFKVFDLENNITNIFPTLTSAAKYFKVSLKTLKHQILVFMIVSLFLNMNLKI